MSIWYISGAFVQKTSSKDVNQMQRQTKVKRTVQTNWKTVGQIVQASKLIFTDAALICLKPFRLLAEQEVLPRALIIFVWWLCKKSDQHCHIHHWSCAMSVNTSCHQMFTEQNSTSPNSSNDFSDQNLDSLGNELIYSTAVVIALLSAPAVVGNALILATIWRRTFLRTSFHSILSGLAVTDFLTGLISQPLYASFHLVNRKNATVIKDNPEVGNAIGIIARVSANLFVNITIATMTVMSVERWLHMSRRSSRRSSTTSHRRYCAGSVILLFPISSSVVYIFTLVEPAFVGTVLKMTIVNFSFCYVIMSYAYFKVYQIIRRHQLQTQANRKSQNFGQPAIDLAKYKKSVASMLYIFLLFSMCFLPFAVSSAVALITTAEVTEKALNVSLVLVFLSSSLNPGLYIWRMRDIRRGLKQLLAGLRT